MDSQKTLDHDGGLEQDFLAGPKEFGKRYQIQSWLERIPQKSLLGTVYGVPKNNQGPRPQVLEDPLLNQVYKMDMATFLIAEKHSVTNTNKLIALAPDEKTQMNLATQLLDEARHFEAFSHHFCQAKSNLKKRDLAMKRYTTPQIKKFFEAIDEQMDKGNFLAGLVGQNLILEGMAYPIYRYEMRYWSYFDPGLSHIIKGAFADEVNHTGLGETYLRFAISSDIEKKNQIAKLTKDFHLLMKEVFEASIKKFIGLYTAASTPYMKDIGGIEIFDKKFMHELSEKEQTLMLLEQIQKEFKMREQKIGLVA